MKKNFTPQSTGMNRILSRIIPVLFLVLAGVPPAGADQIVDMTGRTVAVPEKVQRVFAVSPSGTYLAYAIDPNAPVGLNFPLWEHEKRFMAKSFCTLPVIGGLVGQGRNINREVLLAAAPDVVIIWVSPDVAVNRHFEEIFNRMKIPWVNVRLKTLDDYPEALLFVGRLLHEEERAAELHHYGVESLRQVKTAVAGIPDASRPRIYYAEGMDGLSTERSGSIHADLIELCGGINVHREGSFGMYGQEKISLEQVILYEPDIILIKEKAFFERISTDPRWKRVKAVREGRYYLIPSVPFNWIDRPPSFMRLLGAKWLVSIIHPELFHIDMDRETEKFYRLFLGVDLNDREVAEVLGR